MKKILLFALLGAGAALVVYFVFLAPPRSRPQDEGVIGKGDLFPGIAIPAPESLADRQYLGLDDKQTFRVADIHADLVLVEILNVHCPHCQRQTQPYNALYARLQADPKTQGRVKIVGFAVGNDLKEVEAFRADFGVVFPVIPDPDFRMHRAIGSSRTPFSLYVRLDVAHADAVVAGTHLGVDENGDALLARLRQLQTLDLATLRRKAPKKVVSTVTAAPILSDERLGQRVLQVISAFAGDGFALNPVALDIPRTVFVATRQSAEGPRKLFAEVVSRPSVCDVCHDVHFIYLFDASGKILALEPLQLTKYGNEPWSEADVAKLRSRVVGKFITAPLPFDPSVDAITSATISSSIIFDSLSHGNELMAALKRKDLL